MNWATVIVSSMSNILSTSVNTNWVIENVEWAAFPANHAMNWASIIVNWVTKV
jgi:hypothetical protein